MAQPPAGATAPRRPTNPAAGGTAPPASPPGAATTPAAPPAAVPPPVPPVNPNAPAPDGSVFGPSANAGGLAAQSNVAGVRSDYTPFMLGDQPPFGQTVTRHFSPQPPPAPSPPHTGFPPSPGARRGVGTTMVAPWSRGFKITDDQSPKPIDRIFITSDYFNNLYGHINEHDGNGLRNVQAFQEILGFEKTFFDGLTSVGMRLPINTLTASSPYPGIGGSNTSLGNMTFFAKGVLWEDEETGNLISNGLAITTPNGPGSFAGAPYANGIRDAQIQDFVGYIWRRDRFYLQGFETIDVPTSANDVTLLYTDAAIGYFVYQDQDPNATVSYMAPTLEFHLNTPLNHRGAYRFNDPFGTPDTASFTFGWNMLFGRRSLFSLGFVEPITGPRPFNFELLLQFNYFFGATSRRPQLAPTPLFLGG